MRENTCVVLCHPSDVRNVGSVIRAVANFGLESVRVVGAEPFNEEDLVAFSSYSYDKVVYETYETLEEALKDRVRVLGTSRRLRDPSAPPSWPAVGLANRLVGDGKTALLFGNERTGLTREEVDRCQALIHIPTSERFESMNLSHAVACIAYELARPTDDTPRHVVEALNAPTPAREAVFAHIQRCCEAVGYPPGRNPEIFTRTLRKILTRANPNAQELSMIAGVFSELCRVSVGKTVKPEKMPAELEIAADEETLGD